MATRSILLVDDDIDFLESLADVIGLQGYTCTIATTLEKAEQMVEHGEYRVVFLDVHLPGVRSVYDSMDRLLEKRAPLRFVLITGDREIEIRDTYSAVIGTILYKPFDVKQVLVMLNRMVAL